MSHAIRWTVEKITQRLELIQGLVYRRRAELPSFQYALTGMPPAKPDFTAQPALGIQGWTEITPNSYWGIPFTDFYLRTTFRFPQGWDPTKPTALHLPIGDAGNFSHPEALVYIDGQPYAACDRHHQEILLRSEWLDGQSHDLLLDGWCGLFSGWEMSFLTKLVMYPCALAQIDQPARQFIALARNALDAARVLDENHPPRPALLNALDDAFKQLDTREPFGERFYASLPRAQAALQTGIEAAGPPLEVSLTAAGHAHIDVAWLWPLAQTRRKAARTFHTVLRLMEQFPAYTFTQSQPQLYEFIRQDQPELFEAIRQRVAEGRWEVLGGMWVEADCNLSGAESLARQFLLGRRYFREHFGAGAESPVLWLPDVFGYAWALPQLIKQAGLDYFFTIKLGWNQYNRIPYDSFWWQGLDGTRVLTHFSTSPEPGSAYGSTYNAKADAAAVLGAWTNFQQKESQTEVFMAYGYGDGGGGPTAEMLENLAVMQGFPGLPQARQRKAGDFFRDLEAESGRRLPVWNGELYLEYHRGTYTSQSRNKRANRKAEFALHDAEFLACLADWLDPGYTYPAETFDQAWKLVCLNQFHDIIPGSSIGPVYAESLAQYGEALRLAGGARDGALASLAARLGGDWLAANPTSFPRSDPLFLPGAEGGLVRGGRVLETQPVEGGLLVDTGEIAPYSVIALSHAERAASPQAAPGCFSGVLENDLLRVEFAPDGDITSIYDKANRRQVLAPGGRLNQFQAFEDRPKYWDAWDIDIYYDDRMWLAEPAESTTLVENGPLRWTLEIHRQVLNSPFVQRISLRRGSLRLDFDTTIEWRERHILLKVAFPVNILSPQATHEIQWGNVQRPTHRNTSWDWARFETCAHKWVDLSEGGYGVSLLNDCKYGHDIRDNVLRLSLLRAPTLPDPDADQGEQRFAYSLLPHTGGWEAGTAAEAYRLNDPLIAWRAGGKAVSSSPAVPPLVMTDSPNLIIETVKRAEDGDGFIVRLYESQRRRGPVTLTAAFQLGRVERVNLLEELQDSLAPQGRSVEFSVRPFEIVSLRLVPVR